MRIVATILLYVSITLCAEGSLVLRRADFNENTMSNGRLVSKLVGNVEFEYDGTVIHSNDALWRRNDGLVDFNGNVRIVTGPQLITCPFLKFNKNQKTLGAMNGMVFVDTAEHIKVTARAGTYRLDKKDLTLAGSPAVYQADTSDHDTLIIRGDQLVYDDSLKIAYSYGNTRIGKGKLAATCVNASYNTKTGYTRLRTHPFITYEAHELLGDSIRDAKGIHRETATDMTDTAISEITADSLYLSISDSGAIAGMDAVKQGHLTSHSSKNPKAINTAAGKVLNLKFSDGKAKRLTIAGSAESVYFLDEGKSRDRNESTGDTITVHFRNSKASFLDIRGGVRGTYYTETGK